MGWLWLSPFNQNIAYVVIGPILFLPNLLIFTSIMRHRALRNHKEYVLLGFLAFFDVLVGCGFGSAGIYRLLLQDNKSPILRAACLKYPHIWFFAGAPSTVSILLPFIAVDRLIAVSRPLAYYSMRKEYSCVVMILMTVVQLGSMCFAISNAVISAPANVDPKCDTRDVFGGAYKRFEALTILLGHITGVSLYIGVIVYFRLDSKQRLIKFKTATNGTAKQRFRDARIAQAAKNREERMIKTFGVFALLSFLTVVLPYSVVLGMELLKGTLEQIEPISDAAYIICIKLAALNPSFNVLVYAIKNNEIYTGIKALILRQELPTNTSQWRVRGPGSIRLFGETTADNSPNRFKYSLAHYQMVKNVDSFERKSPNVRTEVAISMRAG